MEIWLRCFDLLLRMPMQNRALIKHLFLLLPHLVLRTWLTCEKKKASSTCIVSIENDENYDLCPRITSLKVKIKVVPFWFPEFFLQDDQIEQDSKFFWLTTLNRCDHFNNDVLHHYNYDLSCPIIDALHLYCPSKCHLKYHTSILYYS